MEIPIISQVSHLCSSFLLRWSEGMVWHNATRRDLGAQLSSDISCGLFHFWDDSSWSGIWYPGSNKCRKARGHWPESVSLCGVAFQWWYKRNKKTSTWGPRLNPTLSISSTRAPPCKVQRTSQESGDHNQGHPQTKHQSRVSFQGNDLQGRRSGGGGRILYNLGPWGNPWLLAPAPHQPFSSEEKKKKGCLVVCPGSTLVDFLAECCEKYCAPFQGKGLRCDDEGCTRRHVRAFCGVDKGGKWGAVWKCWKEQ